MIGKLVGVVDHIDSGWIILMVGGVGYRVFVSTPTCNTLTVSSEAELQIYTHVREDALLLYGFLDRTEQELFETLISVSGVGPRLALAVLSQLSVDRFVTAVVQSDTRVLTQVSGVGKKTAERLILELKDRLKTWKVPTLTAVSEVGSPSDTGTAADAIAALIGLGYSQDISESAVRSVFSANPDATLEQAIRAALKVLQSS